MEQNLLLEAIERYYRGEMNDEEKTYFENLRKNDSDIDEKVVEHLLFLKELDSYSSVKKLKHTLSSVETKLELEGAIQMEKSNFETKIVNLWRRYKRTITVAAAAAVVVSIFTATGISSIIFEKKNTSELVPLVDNKLNQMENKLHQMESKLNDKLSDAAIQKPKFEANFRATGFLADGRGYIITNAHVVSKAKNLIVENTKGDQYRAISLYSNPVTDLAILKITDPSFKTVSSLPYVFKKEKTELAEQIFTLGYPREEVVYNEGYLSAKSGYYGDTSTYQVSISVNPGNSGGPVMNKNGEIIGIISSKETNADGVVFAIKSKNIFKAVSEINKSEQEDIRLPARNHLKGHTRVQQIKSLEDFVFKVKGN